MTTYLTLEDALEVAKLLRGNGWAADEQIADIIEWEGDIDSLVDAGQLAPENLPSFRNIFATLSDYDIHGSAEMVESIDNWLDENPV